MEMLALKYLNPSLAMAKGHMKRPRHGIRSTGPKQGGGAVVLPEPVPQIVPPVLPLFKPDVIPAYLVPAYSMQEGPNVIGDDGNESITKYFLFWSVC